MFAPLARVSGRQRRSPCAAALAWLASGALVGAGCVGSVSGGGSSGSSDPTAPGTSSSGGPGAVTPPPPPACGSDSTPARIWRISDEDYQRAVADLLPGVDVPEISTPGRSKEEFINVAELYPVSGALVSDLRTSAKAVAAAAVGNLAARMACPG